MKHNFDKAFEFVIGVEGIFGDDPKDTGNWTGGKENVGELRGTKYGISAASYPTKNIRNLTLNDAKAIYRFGYWNNCDCDSLPYPLDIIVFDVAVNMGVSVAKILLAKTTNPRDYLMFRIKKYAGFKNFNIYGRGWINRTIMLYEKFIND